LFWVTIALLPIAVVSVLQGMDRARSDLTEVRDRLVSTARASATPAQNVLASADQIARAVANLPDVRNISPDCNQEMASALRGLMFFTNISRLDAKGRIVCSAVPRSIGLETHDPRAWPQIEQRTDFIVDGQTISRVTHRPIILGLLPLHDSAGRFQGAIGIVIDVQWLDYMIRTSTLPRDSVVALFDRRGTIIASNRSEIAAVLFGGAAMAHGTQTSLRTTNDKDGQNWIYATNALLGDNVFVGFAMPRWSLFGPTYAHVLVDFLLPFLMLALSWLAIWIVTERQLTRWIVYLRRISAAYRAGHYALRPALEGAPSEFRLLGDALADMADSIQDRDRSLRDAVAQKTMLIKEIHHRVKNNLQIVMSLLSLQAVRLQDPAAMAALAQARARINALALVHRILYEIEDQRSVDVRRLLEQLSEQTNEGFGGERRDIGIVVNAIPLRVSGDSAVPIALFAVEALTNAYKHAYPPGRGGTIRIVLEEIVAGILRLSINDDGVGFEEEATDLSAGGQLVKTFGLQLGGTTIIRSTTDHGTVAEMTFPVPQNGTAGVSISR
jgi:two-component sensor histidine kinase